MKKRVLLIDDEADILDTLTQVLRLKGYQVSSATNGAAAVAAAEAERPDLILCDLQMPDVDGLVLTERLKRIVPKTPILLLTGVVFDPEVIEAHAGKRFDAYLSKTVSLKQVIKEVKRLLGEEEPG